MREDVPADPDLRTSLRDSARGWYHRVFAKGHSRIARQAVSILVCRIVAMSFGAAGSIWAARCLGPENLGISGMVISIVSQAGLLISMNQAPLLVREYKAAAGQAERNELIRCITTFRLLLVLVACVACAGVMISGIVPPKFSFAGWFFIPLLFLGTVNAQWSFQAAEKVALQSFVALLTPLLTAASYLMFFRPGMSAASDLIVGCSVASLMGVVFWFVQYRKLSFSGFPIDFRLLGTGWRYVKQGRWLFLAGVTCYTYVGLELPLLGWLRSTEELGQYRTAVTLVGAGAGLLAIVPTLLFPRFVEWRKQGEEFLWHRQRQLARAAGAVVVLGTVLSLLVVPVLHPIVFGSAFASAAWPCAILVVSKLIVLVNGIYAWGLWSDARCDKLMASCMGLAATFSLTLNLALIPRFGMHAAAWVNVGSELLILVACYLMARRRVRMLAVQGEA